MPTGNVIEDGITAARFTEVIGEAVETYSYTKFAYYKPLGYPEGSYRVGPLARLNIAKSMGTPLADAELAEFKQLAAGPVQSSFYYHHARLIEILYGIEKIEQILTDPLILDKHVRATAGVNRLEGAGQAEAPRGTLHHHYKVDENGLITWANLVIATGQNNNAMNHGVLQAAKHYVKDGKFTEGILNRVEAVVRTFDPVPELLDARLRADAAGAFAALRRRRSCRPGRALVHNSNGCPRSRPIAADETWVSSPRAKSSTLPKS